VTIALPPLPARSPSAIRHLADNATLLSRHDFSERVASFTISLDAVAPAFLPGQYVSLGLRDGDLFLQRPYSIASPPGDPGPLEFFIRRVSGGALTSRLWEAQPGTRVHVGPPKGLFRLDAGDPRDRLLVAAGTGLAPFLSILGNCCRRQTASPVLLLHGASHASELGFCERILGWQTAGIALAYVPTVSRPGVGATSSWRGRVGRVESLLADIAAERVLTPRGTVAYLCGNPGMIEACREILAARGFGPADVRIESYQARA
jgi:ferredoxin-NADP reductase